LSGSFYSTNQISQELDFITDQELSFLLEDRASYDHLRVLLESIRNFSNKLVEERTKILADVSFWKGEFTSLKLQLQALVKKKEALQFNKIMEDMRVSGSKYSSEIVTNKKDATLAEDTAFSKIERALFYANKWGDIFTDCYYILNGTHKILDKDII